MTELYWPRDTTFRDAEHNFEAAGEGVYDIPDDADEDEYLDRGWQDADDAPDDLDDDSGEVEMTDDGVSEDAVTESGGEGEELTGGDPEADTEEYSGDDDEDTGNAGNDDDAGT